MNSRLKQLAQRGGMDLGKVQALVDLHDGDEAWVEQVILGADRTQKAAESMGVAYKATALSDDADELDEIDQAYIALRNALDSGDKAEIDAAKQMFAQTVDGSAPIKAHAPAMDEKSKAAKPISLEALVKGYSWDGR